MALTRVQDALVLHDERAAVTPYDYGATVGAETSGNNASYIQAMVAAVIASWDSATQSYGLIATLADKMWTISTGIDITGVRTPGFSFQNGGLYLDGAGIIGLDLSGTNISAVKNLTIIGSGTNVPAVGILHGRDTTLAASPHVLFDNVRTEGEFSKGAVVDLGTEIITYQGGCRFANESKSLSAYAYISVDHAGILDDHVGGLTSPNITLPVAGDGSLSKTLMDLGSTSVIRRAKVNLTVTGITKANPAVVTVSTGTLAGADLDNGDTVYFQNINGMTELFQQVCTVANINTGADTFELSGVDSTAYGTFTSGSVQNQTGPAVLMGGCAQVRWGAGYALAYGSPTFEIDFDNGAPLRDWEVALLCEPDPPSVMKFILGSSARTVQGFRFLNLNYNQTIKTQVIETTGTGPLVIDSGYIRIPNMGTAPSVGMFSDPSIVTLRGFEITVAKEAALNAASGYAVYQVLETAFDRTDKTKDYRSAKFYDVPEFVADSAGQVSARAVTDDDSATAGPYFDTRRITASAAASDAIGQYRFSGRNDAGEDITYGFVGGIIVDPTDGSEDGRINFAVQVNGTPTVVAHVTTNGLHSEGVRVTTSAGTTGGTGRAGAGKQYVEITIAGVTYKVLHDGTV
jgi:hypothetical protein